MTTNEFIRGVKTLGWPPFRGRLWQRNYFEHIIRGERSLNAIREYVADNPRQWEFDRENPASGAGRGKQRPYDAREKGAPTEDEPWRV